MPEPARGTMRTRILAWTLFDFANTAFSVIVVTVIYSRYFTDHVAGGQRWLWGLAVSLSMVAAAALSPPLGAAADTSRHKMRFLFVFSMVCILATGLLFFVQEGMILLGSLMFVLANVGFEGGLVFYDAFLPGLTRPSSYGKVSGYGFAMGYLGALAVLVIVNALLPSESSPEYLFYVRLSFVVAAAFFLVFSLPMFLLVPEPGAGSGRRYIRQGFQKARVTFREIFIRREHPAVARFLVAFFIYNDGILTVIAFAAIFAQHILHMGDREIIVFFAVIQTSAVAGSLLFGVITDAIGPKKTITLTLIIWIAIAVGAYFVTTVGTFYVVALGAGLAIGSSQSSSRTMMALLTPKEREAEYFGFYDGICGKASAVVGPLFYGLLADLTNERLAALSIAGFFLAGLWILRKVPEPLTAQAG